MLTLVLTFFDFFWLLFDVCFTFLSCDQFFAVCFIYLFELWSICLTFFLTFVWLLYICMLFKHFFDLFELWSIFDMFWLFSDVCFFVFHFTVFTLTFSFDIWHIFHVFRLFFYQGFWPTIWKNLLRIVIRRAPQFSCFVNIQILSDRVWDSRLPHDHTSAMLVRQMSEHSHLGCRTQEAFFFVGPKNDPSMVDYSSPIRLGDGMGFLVTPSFWQAHEVRTCSLGL